MEKLELKHIASYLPYGLHGFVVTNRANFEVEIVGWNYNTLKTSPSIHGYTHCPFEQFHPILHPLSDLVKPCLPKGEIPIVELAKKHIEYDESIGDSDLEVKYALARQMRIDITWRHPSSDKPLYSDDLFIQTRRTHLNMFWVNEWLFEHHFDVYGLIDQNLAVDINKIEP